MLQDCQSFLPQSNSSRMRIVNLGIGRRNKAGRQRLQVKRLAKGKWTSLIKSVTRSSLTLRIVWSDHHWFFQPPTDFFGRPITRISDSTMKAAARKNVEKKYRVTYRFLEGNSAAVRKPIKVGTFL